MYVFGSFEFDCEGFCLRRDGHDVRLHPKTFDLLRFLIERRDRVVTKRELLEGLWPDATVVECVLPTQVSKLRRALGQRRPDKEPIATVHGRGYRFVAPVQAARERGTAPKPEPGLLEMACLFAGVFDAPTLARALRRDAAAIWVDLQQAVQAGWLSRQGDGGYLMDGVQRDAIRERLGDRERRRLHAVIGKALARAPCPPWAEIAFHYASALPFSNANRAVAYALRASEGAARRHDHSASVRVLGHTLDALRARAVIAPQAHAELSTALANARLAAGDYAGATTACHTAVQVARAHRLPRELANAALALRPLGPLANLPDERNHRDLTEALAHSSDAPADLRARLLARMSMAPSAADAEGLSEAALALITPESDPSVRFDVHCARGAALLRPGRLSEALAAGDDMLRMAARHADDGWAAEGHAVRYLALLALGKIGAADTQWERFGASASRSGQPLLIWHDARCQAQRAAADGNLEAAQARMIELARTGERLHGPWSRIVLKSQLHWLADLRGELPALSGIDTKKVARAFGWVGPNLQASLALLDASVGRTTAARRRLNALMSEGLPSTLELLPTLANAARAAILVDDLESLEALVEVMRPLAHLNAVSRLGLYHGALAHFLGLGERALGRLPASLRSFEQALTLNDTMGARPMAAWTAHELAQTRALAGHEVGPIAARAARDAATLGLRAM